MKWMHSLRWLACLLFTFACFAESAKTVDGPTTTVRGKLVQHEGHTPAIETAEHKLIALAGDGSTEHVLHDSRLAGVDLEAKGHFTAADRFQVDPFHTQALHVIKGGKRMVKWSSDSRPPPTYTRASSAHAERSTRTQPPQNQEYHR